MMKQQLFFNYKFLIMKKVILFFSAIVLFSLTIMAQPPQKPMYNKGGGGAYNKENIQAMKIAFLTKHLALTELQATSFWPIYNKYEAEKKVLRKNTIGEEKLSKSLDEISDIDANKVIDNYYSLKTKELELSKKYTEDFKKVLEPKQVAKLITSEAQFKKMLMQGHNGYNKQGPPKPQIQPTKPVTE